MRPETINAMRLPSGAWRVWVEGHAATCMTANSKAEAIGLLVIHHPGLGIEVKEKESI
jgi:hypothetical protein